MGAQLELSHLVKLAKNFIKNTNFCFLDLYFSVL